MIRCKNDNYYANKITVNDKSLAWLKFGKFGEFAYFTKLLFIQSLILPNILDKFAKLYAAKFITMQFHQTLTMLAFRYFTVAKCYSFSQ